MLLILCTVILWYQFKYARRVEILEHYSRNYMIIIRIISVIRIGNILVLDKNSKIKELFVKIRVVPFCILCKPL